MALRWYSVVVDCRDVAAQAAWWARALGWAQVVDLPEEMVLVPPHALTDMDSMPREHRGPGLVFVRVAEGKEVKNRLHLDLAPWGEDDHEAEVARLLDLGARRVEVGQSALAETDRPATWTVLADPEGNEFCVLSSRDE
ncbi:VOC family protein [Auraticoccus monumenti]|uniref:Glyoxalase-like domain-containing protein n=1 Tax=Auraticoccus monumenti TaxID=675864 RepID=A0A1G6XMS0_9ACTN|nr:VOC family protein [Auraticoccus monumenti]SDD78647.1 hypothetical protein SAMN04489747_1738 [Auraticoccus monumenti]